MLSLDDGALAAEDRNFLPVGSVGAADARGAGDSERSRRLLAGGGISLRRRSRDRDLSGRCVAGDGDKSCALLRVRPRTGLVSGELLVLPRSGIDENLRLPLRCLSSPDIRPPV